MSDRGTGFLGADRRNYPLNCWYVAATSEEVDRRLVGRRILGQPVLLYRQDSGTVVALEDRCAHRSLPLSRGRLVDDQVVCAYHGFTFAPTGECVRVPSQEQPPYGARVRTFPVREQAPFVWIWLGERGRSTWSAPPGLPWFRDDRWTIFGGVLQVDANYMLLHENALDLTHLAFVHPDMSPLGYFTKPPPLEVEATETSVSYSRMFPPTRLAGWQAEVTGLKGDEDYPQRESGVFVSPGLHIDHMDVLVSPDGQETDQAYEKVFIRAFTPEGPSRTRVFWYVARNFATDRAEVTDILRAVHEKSMLEDKSLLESIEELAAVGGGAEFSVNADIATLKARQIVAMMLAEEWGRSAVRPGFGDLRPPR